MNRDLPAMADTLFDVLVIGGGITGALIAWDATLRGLRVGLVEKEDFGQGASSPPVKHLSSGFAPLQQLAFDQARLLLRELQVLLTVTPHLVQPCPVLRPAPGWGRRLRLSIAGRLHNRLARDASLPPHERAPLPPAQILDTEHTQQRAPTLDANALAGSLLHYDGQVYAPARHVMEFLHSATRHGAQVANYAEAIDFALHDGTLQAVTVRDHLTDAVHTLRTRYAVNATGAWIPQLLQRIDPAIAFPGRRTKAIYVVIRSDDSTDTTLLGPLDDGRRLRCMPWRGHTLIGPVELPMDAPLSEAAVTETELQRALNAINAAVPHAQFTRDDVLHFHGAPHLHATPYSTTENAIRSHADDGVNNLFTAYSSPTMPPRRLAEQLIARIIETLDRPAVPCTTDAVPTVGGDTGSFPQFLNRIHQRYPTLSEATAYHLARCYGTRITAVMDQAQRGPVLMQPPCDRTPDIMAQVDYAVEHEMAYTLDDVLLRRTGIGVLGEPTLDTLESVAQRMAGLLGWDTHRFDGEVETMRDRYWPVRTVPPTTA